MNSDRKRDFIPDRVKNVIIIVLAVSAVFLGSRTGMYSQLFRASPFISSAARYVSELLNGGHQASGTSVKAYSQAAKPFAVASRAPGEGMYAAIWDADELELQYDSFSAALGEALGSAGDAEEITEQTYRSSLENDSCVYFDFYYPQQLSLLAGWLGTSMASGHSASAVLLAEDQELASVLCYKDDATGKFYRCATQLSWSSVSTKLTGHGSTPVSFSYMLGYGASGMDPYAIIPDAAPVKTGYTAKNPFRVSLSPASVLPAFSMNGYVASAYQESDGTTVYVESDYTLRISADGRVTFRSAVNGDGTASTADSLERAYKLASACAGLCSSGLDVSLISSQRQNGECIFRFAYLLNGLPLELNGDPCAAEIRVSSSGVTWASILFRSYEDTGESMTLLPAALQAAVVQASGGGGLRLAYQDNGQTASPQWTTN